MLNWLLGVLLDRHRFVHERGESFIKCECGATVEFEEIPPPGVVERMTHEPVPHMLYEEDRPSGTPIIPGDSWKATFDPEPRGNGIYEWQDSWPVEYDGTKWTFTSPPITLE